MTCRMMQEDRTIRLTCIHAPYNYHQRYILWDEIRQISNVNNFPWICAGDFNEILYRWEKIGKRPTDLTRMLSFRVVLND